MANKFWNDLFFFHILGRTFNEIRSDPNRKKTKISFFISAEFFPGMRLIEMKLDENWTFSEDKKKIETQKKKIQTISYRRFESYLSVLPSFPIWETNCLQIDQKKLLSFHLGGKKITRKLEMNELIWKRRINWRHCWDSNETKGLHSNRMTISFFLPI